MTARLATRVRATALIRRAESLGGTGMVLARGDADAGGLLVILTQRGEIARLLEQGRDLEGRSEWRDAPPQVTENTRFLSDYVTRRRSRDADLWVLELDIADTQRFAAEMAAAG